MVGLSLLLITVRPMRPGATLMNDFLFNVALMLLATNAAIQFCAQAFALYADESTIHEIWGSQVNHPAHHSRSSKRCSWPERPPSLGAAGDHRSVPALRAGRCTPMRVPSMKAAKWPTPCLLANPSSQVMCVQHACEYCLRHGYVLPRHPIMLEGDYQSSVRQQGCSCA